MELRFSQRIGKKAVKNTIQIESIDEDLKNSLWSGIVLHYINPLHNDFDKAGLFGPRPLEYKSFIQNIWFNFFKLPLDQIPWNSRDLHSFFKEHFYDGEWYEILDFIEAVPKIISPSNSQEFREFINNILKREMSAYRFVNEEIVEITDEEEIKTIEKAIESAKKSKFSGVKIHLEDSLKKLSHRKNPDYRNSIKESISAVESICSLIVGKQSALSTALKKIEDEKIVKIHPALKSGFEKIYGYTSDGDGIRHSLMDETNLDFEDALYMLVSCSSFINYLISKIEKSKLSI